MYSAFLVAMRSIGGRSSLARRSYSSFLESQPSCGSRAKTTVAVRTRCIIVAGLLLGVRDWSGSTRLFDPPGAKSSARFKPGSAARHIRGRMDTKRARLTLSALLLVAGCALFGNKDSATDKWQNDAKASVREGTPEREREMAEFLAQQNERITEMQVQIVKSTDGLADTLLG